MKADAKGAPAHLAGIPPFDDPVNPPLPLEEIAKRLSTISAVLHEWDLQTLLVMWWTPHREWEKCIGGAQGKPNQQYTFRPYDGAFPQLRSVYSYDALKSGLAFNVPNGERLMVFTVLNPGMEFPLPHPPFPPFPHPYIP